MAALEVVQFLPWKRIAICLRTQSPISYPPVKFELIEEKESEDEEEVEASEEGTIRIDPDAPLDDYYALLGVQHRDHLATEREIARAYRKISLKFHPDRVHDKDPDAAEERYKCIQKAYDVLKDPVERRIYDSSREFDDSIPHADTRFSDPDEFYQTYGKAFNRYSRWSTTRPVPRFGNADTKLKHVSRFYQFWQSFKSWRDFSYKGEYNIKDAENRDERRWMEQQNKREAKSQKKEETQRIMALVSQAKKQDPRYISMLEQQQAEIDEIRRKKKEAKRRAAQERSRAEREKKEAEERRRQAQLQAKLDQEKRRDQRKKEIKQWKRWLNKATRQGACLEQFRDRYTFLNSEGTYEDWEKISALCVPDINEDICTTHQQTFDDMYSSLQERVKERKMQEEEERRRKIEEAKRLEAEKKAREFWTDKELDFLVKGVQKFPGGTVDRWEKIRDSLPKERTVEEVISKVKSLAKQSRKGKNFTAKAPTAAPVESPPRAKAGEDSTSDTKKKKKKKKKDKEGKEKKDKKKKKKKKDKEEASDVWSISQQQALETALRTFRALPANEKWDKISEAVEKKSRKDCIERFKYIRAQLLAQRAQQTAV